MARLAPAVSADLEQVVGSANLLQQPEDLIPFSFDGTAGLRQMPAAVVFPRSVEQVAKTRGKSVSDLYPHKTARPA